MFDWWWLISRPTMNQRINFNTIWRAMRSWDWICDFAHFSRTEYFGNRWAFIGYLYCTMRMTQQETAILRFGRSSDNTIRFSDRDFLQLRNVFLRSTDVYVCLAIFAAHTQKLRSASARNSDSVVRFSNPDFL